jgi:hypothetical protein
MNRFTQGIALEEQTDTYLPAEKGVVLEAVRGVPVEDSAYIEAREHLLGIPMTGPGMQMEEELPAPKCAGTTKKGDPCKAYAIKRGVFCVGHMTVQDK